MSRMRLRKEILSKQRRHGSRRRGMAVVWLALTMTVMLGMAALTIDQGFHLTRRAQAQRAADAAALAGAWKLANFESIDSAKAAAVDYAGRNGYSTGNNATVDTIYPVPGLATNLFKVDVYRPERMFFGSAFIKLLTKQDVSTRTVGAKAVALYETLAPMNINGGGTYGINDGPATLAMFGPDGLYTYGDCYSTKKLNNGTKNPLYTGKGYDFYINVPATYNQTKMWIFDPDCAQKDNIADALPGVRIDEWRKANGADGVASDATTTRYTLYRDNGTPYNPSDDVQIAQASYGNVSSTDMKWVVPPGFEFNRQSYAGQNFRLNATTISGASENGFNIRIGHGDDNPAANIDTSDYDGTGRDGGVVGVNGVTAGNKFPGNGTEITATGHMPMNFNRSGSATVTLGFVPGAAVGKQLVVRKYDTDVGSTTVTYTCDQLPGYSFAGVLSGNGEFKTDNIPVPTNYPTTGGTWKATYTAGLMDTSVWDMSYTGAGPGQPGQVRLVM